MVMSLRSLFHEGAITKDDLDGFSDGVEANASRCLEEQIFGIMIASFLGAMSPASGEEA